MAAKRTALPDLDPNAMLVFAAIARQGGVRGAAETLGVPRSTVSRRLADLERALGAALVVRTSRRFELTEIGLVLAQRCEALDALLAETEDLVQRGATAPSGILRVAAAPVLGEEILPGVIAVLLARFPALRIELSLSPDYADLRSGEVDVALRAWPVDDASDLYATKLGTSVTGCFASPSYIAARGAPRTPAELAAHDCVVVGGAVAPTWKFRVGGADQSIPVSGRVRVDNFRVARDLATHGGGIARMARHFADDHVAVGSLLPLLEPYWIETPLHAVHAGSRTATPKVRAFVDLVREAMSRPRFRAQLARHR